MGNIIDQIHQDHIHMARVLDLLDDEIDKLLRGGLPDCLILEHAMRYMVSYPDQIHHPKEDALFRRLIERDPSVTGTVEDLAHEHELLAQKGEEFYDLIRAAGSGDFVSREEMISKGTDYVKTLRAHMNTEEGDVLKKARASLSKEDLAEAGAEVDSIHDPLFGEVVDKQYKELYNYIIGHSRDTPETQTS